MQPETIICEFMLLIFSISIIIYKMWRHIKKSLQLILYTQASREFIPFQEMLHNAFYLPQNTIYFIFSCSNNMFSTNLLWKFEYQSFGYQLTPVWGETEVITC